MNRTSEELDQIDSITKNLSQAKSILTSLQCEDHVKIVSEEITINMLWCATDRIDESLREFEKLTEKK